MILALSLLALLLATNTGEAAIKGRRVIQEPSVIQDVSQPHIHVSKGGGGGAFHQSAVLQDPVSGGPVLVNRVSRLGSSGGIKSSGLGAGSAQYALSDGPFGRRRLYRVGPAQYPFGLLGSDYYSYPNYLLNSPRRALGRKTLASNNFSGLRPIGLRKGGVLADPLTSQFSIGDAQIKTGGYGLRRNLYRTGLSPVPYGLMGLDYYSYPNQLLTQRRLADPFGLGQTRILTGGSPFTAGDSQLRGPIVSPQEKVTVVETDPNFGTQRVTTVQKASPFGTISLGAPSAAVIPQQVAVLDDGLGDGFGQRKVTTTVTQSADPVAAALGQGQVTQTTVTRSAGGGGLKGLRGGQIILSGGQGIGGLRRVKTRPSLVVGGPSGLGAPIGGFGQRQIVQAPIVQAPVVQTLAAAPIQRRVITRRPGEVFLSQVGRPRVTAFSRPSQVVVPVSQQRVAVVPQSLSAPVISQVKTSPNIFGRTIFGNRSPQMIYIDGGNRFLGIDLIGGSRIGDPRMGYTQLPFSGRQFSTFGGLTQAHIPVQSFGSSLPVAKTTISQAAPFGFAGVGRAAPAQVVTQEEVVGPVGDRQIVTTVTKASPQSVLSSPSKIGGGIVSSPLGLASVAPSKTVTQEEVVGPLGDRQVITTVTNNDPNRLVGSKIGGLAVGGLSGIGHSPSQIVTQEEVVGPAGDPQVITTVTDTGAGGLGSSKIGGLATGGPLGLTAVGRSAPSKTVTQEEVVGPLGDRQVITTVTKNDPNHLVGSKIGGLAVGGLSGIGQVPSKVVTQEEVIGPAGDSQVITTVTDTGAGGLGASKIGGLATGGPLGVTAFGRGASSKTVTQEEVVGPLGDRQVVTTVTDNDPSRLVGSKIGGLASGGLSGIGQVPSKVVTQEEVIGPAGDSQVITTVTDTGAGGLGSSKIGGLATGGPLGLTAIGRGAPSKTVTQEEVVGPLGDRQVVTTVTQNDPSGLVGSKIGGLAGGGPLGLTAVGRGGSAIVQQEEVLNPLTGLRTTSQLSQELAQDPIETALVQEALGGSLLSSPLSQQVQSLVDPLSSGQVSVDDIVAQSPFSGLGGSGVTQVKETTYTEPSGIALTAGGPVATGGTVTKVTEVSQGGLGGNIVQQNIADAVVQERISPGLGSLFGYDPRLSFLSQYPYDIPDTQLLRSVLTRPVVQQQEVEQILVK